MAYTSTPLPRSYVDHVAGLRYLDRLGPDLPALNAAGLGYVRDDLLARAAAAEAQAEQAFTAGNLGLTQRADGIASACRDAAAQIVRYALDPAWQQQ
jgi:hypothetical protein